MKSYSIEKIHLRKTSIERIFLKWSSIKRKISQKVFDNERIALKKYPIKKLPLNNGMTKTKRERILLPLKMEEFMLTPIRVKLLSFSFFSIFSAPRNALARIHFDSHSYFSNRGARKRSFIKQKTNLV